MSCIFQDINGKSQLQYSKYSFLPPPSTMHIFLHPLLFPSTWYSMKNNDKQLSNFSYSTKRGLGSVIIHIPQVEFSETFNLLLKTCDVIIMYYNMLSLCFLYP